MSDLPAPERPHGKVGRFNGRSAGAPNPALADGCNNVVAGVDQLFDFEIDLAEGGECVTPKLSDAFVSVKYGLGIGDRPLWHVREVPDDVVGIDLERGHIITPRDSRIDLAHDLHVLLRHSPRSIATLRHMGRALVSVLALVTAVALGGCGSDEDGGKKPASPTRAYASTTTATTLKKPMPGVGFEGSGVYAGFYKNGKELGPWSFEDFYVPGKNCGPQAEKIHLSFREDDAPEGDDHSFNVKGTWRWILNSRPESRPGTLKAKVSDDRQTVTLTWSAFLCNRGGTDVKLSRVKY